MEGALDILCDKHVIPMILFLKENGPCGKTKLYHEVSRNSNIPAKLDRMANHGLITMEAIGTKSAMVSLTELGDDVAERLLMIDAILSEHYLKML